MKRLELKGYEEEFLDAEEFMLHIDDSGKLRELEKLYLSNIEKGIEVVDYQLIFQVISNLNLQIDNAVYLSVKNNKSELLNTLLRNQFRDCALEDISKKFRDYIVRLLITYIDLEEPIFIDAFVALMKNLIQMC